MGCCVSTIVDRNNNKNNHSSVSEKNRAPPTQPPVFEEETVKEVLSETPNLKTSAALADENRVEKKGHFQNSVLEKIREEEEPETLKIRKRMPKALVPAQPGFFKPDKNEDEVSKVSEICSLTSSGNVSTAAMNDGKTEYGGEEEEEEEEEEEVRQNKKQTMRQRSPEKSRNRVVGNNYPTRRSEQSPGKRRGVGTGSSRLVEPEKDPGRVRGTRPGTIKRDPGERSGRRSRSPATNRTVMGPTSAAIRRTNQSPGRVRLDWNERKVEQQGRRPNSSNNYNGAPGESLENPLVSLECFIFL